MDDSPWCMERRSCERTGAIGVIIEILITDRSEVAEKINTSSTHALGPFRTSINVDIFNNYHNISIIIKL